MSELYKLGYMDGLTGVFSNTNEKPMFLSMKYLEGCGDGLEVRLTFYKPDLYN